MTSNTDLRYTAEGLERCALDLETNGWVRNTLRKMRGNKQAHCLAGVLQDNFSLENRYLADQFVQLEINKYPIGACPISYWNDSQTDKRKVVRLLRRAAHAALKQAT